MTYLIDKRDVDFTLFEYLKVQDLTQYSAFSGFSAEDFKMLLEEGLKFAQKEIAPLNKIGDEKGTRFENGQVLAAPGFKEAYKKFAENGFIGLDVPATYGGQGLPMGLTMAFSEFFGGSNFSFMMFPGLTRGAAHLIEVFGKEELAQLYCPKMYSGEWLGTMCLTEPQAGSAVGDLSTIATPVGDGTYQIKGGKIFISCGDHDVSDNIVHMVLARIEGDPEGTKGISLFLVPKVRVNADGSLAGSNDVKTVNIEHKLGINASPTCTLAFGDNNGCVGYLIGEKCKGMSYMFQMMNEARLLCGMQGLGAAGNAYQHSVQYAKERIQGGKTPIIEYPDVRRMLAKMKSLTEAMRGLLYQVGIYIDKAKHETDPAEKEKYQDLADLLTPICKAYCTDIGFELTADAMQVYGGYGYSREYPIEQMMRDVKISSIYEGTNGIQSLDLIGRKMALKGGKLFRDFYAMLDEFCSKNGSHPAFQKEFEAFKKALDTVGQTAMKVAQVAMGGEPTFAMLHAVPFLQMIGNLTFAWILLSQAVLSLPKLESIWSEAGANDEEKKSSICENNLDARFYEGKVKTARFYIWNLLPEVRAKSQIILSEDRSALKIRF